MKEKIVFLLLILFCFSFVSANSPKEAVEKYYSSSASENLEEYFSVVDLSGLTEEDTALEKMIVELTWNTIDEQTYSIKEMESVMDETGTGALVQFKLSASYKNTKTGETTSFNDVDYIALLSKQENWKIVYSIPMKEYLELRQRTLDLKAVEEEMQTFKEEEPKTEGKLLVDGKPYTGNPEKGSLLGLIDSLIFGVQVIIAIIVLLLILSFFTGNKKEEKSSGGQNVVVNVNSNGSQPTKKQETQKKMKALGVKLNPETKKEFSDAMKILRKRYATGEITKKEFNQMKKDLGN